MQNYGHVVALYLLSSSSCLTYILAKVPESTEIGCFVAGECLHSYTVGVSLEDTPTLCLDFCKDTDGCQVFTHYQSNSICALYSECVQLSADSCDDCISGEATCDPIACNEPGKRE